MTQPNRIVNGNYYIDIYDDDTRTRQLINPADSTGFAPAYPENIDLKISHITNYGKVIPGDVLYNPHVMEIKPYTSVSIIDSMPLAYPSLIKLAETLSIRHIAVDVTVKQEDAIGDLGTTKILYELIRQKFIRTLNITLTNAFDPKLYDLFDVVSKPVIDVTVGIVTDKELDELRNKRISIMVNGFSKWRAQTYPPDRYGNIVHNLFTLRRRVPMLLNEFSVVGLDALSVKQLQISDTSKFVYDRFLSSMFIDLVHQQYGPTTNPMFLKSMRPHDTLMTMFASLQ